MQRWDEIQSKAKKMIDEGLGLLREGLSEADFLAGTTASAAKLHMETGKKKIELYRTQQEIGAKLVRILPANLSSQRPAIPVEVDGLVAKARAIESQIRNAEKKMEEFSIVKRGGTPPADGADPSARAGHGAVSTGRSPTRPSHENGKVKQRGFARKLKPRRPSR